MTLPIPPPPRSAVPSSSPASPRLAGKVPGSDSRKGTSFLPSGGRPNPRPVPPYFRPRRPDPPRVGVPLLSSKVERHRRPPFQSPMRPCVLKEGRKVPPFVDRFAAIPSPVRRFLSSCS
ncbi:hypothetical protein ZWY2020_012384 [Hordeum vulgare]|nr:hypothetical protein ZWY2020_012384 [Hordeum vulgare]